MRIKILELLKKFIATDCVFKKVFHMYCPGCGGTRAWKALIRLNILQSLYDNPVVIFLFIFFLLRIFLLMMFVIDLLGDFKTH